MMMMMMMMSSLGYAVPSVLWTGRDRALGVYKSTNSGPQVFFSPQEALSTVVGFKTDASSHYVLGGQSTKNLPSIYACGRGRTRRRATSKLDFASAMTRERDDISTRSFTNKVMIAMMMMREAFACYFFRAMNWRDLYS